MKLFLQEQAAGFFVTWGEVVFAPSREARATVQAVLLPRAVAHARQEAGPPPFCCSRRSVARGNCCFACGPGLALCRSLRVTAEGSSDIQLLSEQTPVLSKPPACRSFYSDWKYFFYNLFLDWFCVCFSPYLNSGRWTGFSGDGLPWD